MAKFRQFQADGRRLRLVEDLEARKRDIKNWSVTLQDLEDGAVYTYFQNRGLRDKVHDLPLSVKIYTTPREILESMLRAAISDTVIQVVFDFSRSACRKRTSRSETRTLRAIATQAALSSYGKTFRAKIEDDGILLLKVLHKEFGTRESEEFADIVFDKLRDLFKNVIIDIREVTYMNSSGISVLARTAADMPTRIVGVSENVRSVMDLMGLLPLLNLDDSQESAFRVFRGDEGGGEDA
jgi:anti-anti-sigma factor